LQYLKFTLPSIWLSDCDLVIDTKSEDAPN